MSEQPAETQQPNPDAIELAPSGDGAFAQLMDALAPEPEAGQGGAAAPAVGDPAPAGGTADAPGDGAAQPGAGEDPPAAGTAGAPADGGKPGDGGDPKPAAGSAEQPAAGADSGARPESWTATADELMPQISALSTALEENTEKAYMTEALSDVRTEYTKYFEALETHPRLLVGQTVPVIGGEGTEVLKDTADAREWQEAVKTILQQEVRSRASVKLDENKQFLTTIHSSIDLFKNNPDLIPGTKDFDVELANRFATMCKDYELRVDGKLQGYSVPVQPLIDQIREQLIQTRAAATAAPEAPSPASGTQSQQPAADPPQAGITSKPGSGAEQESFETLFGTLGVPNLRI